MAWLFGSVARCEEAPASTEAAKTEDAPKKDPKESPKEDDVKSDVKSGPKNTGDDPKINAEETEKAQLQTDGDVQASSGAGMAEVQYSDP
jgi:hypothetical protein